LKLITVPGEKSLSIQLLALDVYLRKDKLLLCLKAMKKALKISSENPELHKSIVRFLHKFETTHNQLSPVVKEIIELELAHITQVKSATEYNTIYLSKFSNSLIHNLAVAESMYIMDPTKKSLALDLINFNIEKSLNSEDHIKVYEAIRVVFGEKDRAEKYKELAASHFPKHNFFNSPHHPPANQGAPTIDNANSTPIQHT